MGQETKLLDTVHIYIVDDDDAVADSLAAVFEMHGATVETFSSLIDARKSDFSGEPSFFLFDLHLTDGLGNELLTELRDRGLNAPAFLMTGQLDIPNRGSLLKLCQQIVEKPVDGDDLAAQIAAALALGKAQSDIPFPAENTSTDRHG